MQNILNFLINDTMSKITFFISVFSFILSVYNFVLNLLQNRKNIELSFGFVTDQIHLNQYLQINFVNKSCKPISISRIQIENSFGVVQIENQSKIYLSNDFEACYTSSVPLYICGYGCFSGCFSFRDENNRFNVSEAVKVTIGTNRGTIKKKMFIPDSFSLASRISDS